MAEQPPVNQIKLRKRETDQAIGVTASGFRSIISSFDHLHLNRCMIDHFLAEGQDIAWGMPNDPNRLWSRGWIGWDVVQNGLPLIDFSIADNVRCSKDVLERPEANS